MLLFSIIAYAAFGSLCLYWIISGSKKLKQRKNESALAALYENEAEYEAALEATKINFDEKYFERIRNGERSQQFLSIGGVKDCVMIRSLLYSENIPTYTENESINKIYTIAPDAPADSSFAIKMFILIADYEKAYEIVKDYVESCNPQEKTSESEENKKDSEIKETSEPVTTGTFFAIVHNEAEPITIGVTVLPKLVEE